MELISPADAAGRVTAALKGAAQATGAGFDYLLRTAKRESSLDPSAKASTSSARGLFQFIDQTWLEVLKEEGPKLGLADAAADVTRTSSGRYTVQDPARRAEILALRDDPRASALLAGAFTGRNAATMSSALGRSPTEGELYAAHFMGAQGATQLVTLAASSPSASAADAFPAHAAANRAIFYDRGRERSAIEVYAKLTATPDVSAISAVATTTTAYAPIAQSRRPAAVEAVETVAVYNNGVENDREAFHSMFKTGRRSPVSAYVSQAWSAFGEAGLASDAAGVSSAAPVARTAVAGNVRAYADPAGAIDTTVKASAAEAVTVAATRVVKRAPIEIPSTALSAKTAVQTSTAPAKTEIASAPFDLIAFLRDAFKGPAATGSERRSARP